MPPLHKIDRCFVKKDWGSGRLTWRETDDTTRQQHGAVALSMRRVTNRKAKVMQGYWS